MARILAFRGAHLTREYSFNDHDTQIDRFTQSLVASALGQPPPNDEYNGAYIRDIATSIIHRHPAATTLPEAQRHDIFRREGLALMRTHITTTLHEFGTDFDTVIHDNSQNTIDHGHHPRMYIRGADHRDPTAATQPQGYDSTHVEIIHGNRVTLIRNGNAVTTSTRTKTTVTLDDLVEFIGVDAARYALIRTPVDQPLDIDVNLWARHTTDNPIVHVQHAHARLCSLARHADTAGITATNPNYALLTTRHEGTLIRTLGEFPSVVESSARRREPHRIARYVEKLAATFHRFYGSGHILPTASEPTGDDAAPLVRTRLALAQATRHTITNACQLLGVTAPERM